MATEIARCHRIVWHYRAVLEPVWPTPPPDDALRFAHTEAGEAMDAYLRLNGGYARNRDRDLSVEAELADCAMMLLTAAPRLPLSPGERMLGDARIMGDWANLHNRPARRYYLLEPDPYSPVNILHNVAYRVGELLVARGTVPRMMTLRLVGLIARYPGMDLDAWLTSRLERIKARREA